MTQEQKTKSEFEVAQEIKALLEALPAEKREMALRWARESVGLPAQTAALQASVPLAAAVAGPGAGTGHIPGSTEVSAAPRKKTLKEFVAEKQPKSDVQFAAVAAYYHQFEAPEGARRDHIGADDLQDAARLSGRARFKTPSTTLNNAVGLGYLDRGGERGTYRLNAIGENLVAMALPGNGGGTAPTGRARRRARATERAAPRRGAAKKGARKP